MKKAKLLLSVIAIALVFYTCSKDQKVVKELNGDWSVTSVTTNGIADTTDYSQDVYTFTKCKVKKGPCDGSWTSYDPTKGLTTMTFTYSISGDGTIVTLNINIPIIGVTTTIGDIKEHTKTKFVWTVTNGTDVTETTLTKK